MTLAWVLSGRPCLWARSQFRMGPRAPRVSGSQSAQSQSRVPEPKQHSGRGHGVSGCRCRSSWAVRLCSHPRPCPLLCLDPSFSLTTPPQEHPARPLFLTHPRFPSAVNTPVRGCCLAPSGLAELSVPLRASTSAHLSPPLLHCCCCCCCPRSRVSPRLDLHHRQKHPSAGLRCPPSAE